jgi:hypothetical protein
VPVAPFFDSYHRAVRIFTWFTGILFFISIIWSILQPLVLWHSPMVHLVSYHQWISLQQMVRTRRDYFKSIDLVLPLMRFSFLWIAEAGMVAARLSLFGDNAAILVAAVAWLLIHIVGVFGKFTRPFVLGVCDYSLCGLYGMGCKGIFIFARRFDPFVKSFFEEQKRNQYTVALNLKDLPIDVLFANEVDHDIHQVVSRDVHGFFTTDLFTAYWRNRSMIVRLGRSHYLRKQSQLTKRDEDESKEVRAWMSARSHRNVVHLFGLCVDFASAPNAKRQFAFFMENLIANPTLEEVIKRHSTTTSAVASTSAPTPATNTNTTNNNDGGVRPVVPLSIMTDDNKHGAPIVDAELLARRRSQRRYIPRDPTPPLSLINWYTIINLARDIAHGLSHLHGNGICHRELVSKNVWLRSSYQSAMAQRWQDKLRDHSNDVPLERSLEQPEMELVDLSDRPDVRTLCSTYFLFYQSMTLCSSAVVLVFVE